MSIERLTAKWNNAPVKAVPVIDGELVRFDDYMVLWNTLLNTRQVLKFITTDLKMEENERSMVKRALARAQKTLDLKEGPDCEDDTESAV